MFGFVLAGVISFVPQQKLSDELNSVWQLKHVYRATLACPGGEIPFILVVEELPPKWRACVFNGEERINIPHARRPQIHSYEFEFNHYRSKIKAMSAGGPFCEVHELKGHWIKEGGDGKPVEMDFSAEGYQGYLFKPNLKITEEIEKPTTVDGRWSVKFSSDDSPAIGVFKEGKDKSVDGTFLTTTGDYRYLAGSYEHGLLRLSCFDGSHAFLFHARMQSDGTLKGDFWSGAKWHETWTAKRDDKAALPDGFSLTKINPKAKLKDLRFPDLNGKARSLSEPGLLGKATIVEIFGSWCPNCHDAAELLVDLEKKYGPRGLKVVGLAFESGDARRDAQQVKRYLERHKATYTALIAGVRDRKKASAALPVIEELKSFPTFLFVDADGTVRSVYSGFSGPATGEEYTKLRKQFEAAIEKLLANER